jgi:hypothetical protein
MNLLFAADSPWVWDAEKNYRILVEENPELVRAAKRGSMALAAGDLENGVGGRKLSLATGAERRHSQAGTEKDVMEKNAKDV